MATEFLQYDGSAHCYRAGWLMEGRAVCLMSISRMLGGWRMG
jgi:hypothetical protein